MYLVENFKHRYWEKKKFQAKNGEKFSFRAKYWPIFGVQKQAGAELKKKKEFGVQIGDKIDF